MDHRQRLAWARKHIQDLDTEIDTFLFSKDNPPYKLRYHQRTRGKEHSISWTFEELRELPKHWPLMVGDIVHSLRSALDNLAYSLVLANNGKPTAETQFLICDHAEAFAKRRKGRIGAMSVEAQAEIEGLQPYKSALAPPQYNTLSALRDLSNEDKHRHLLLTYAALEKATITVDIPGFKKGGQVRYSGPLKHGTVVSGFTFSPPVPHADVKMQANLPVVVAFGDGKPGHGANVIHFFQNLSRAIPKLVFEPLEPFL